MKRKTISITPELFKEYVMYLDEELINKLFYLSLFDPSSWEEDHDFDIDDINDQIKKILKNKRFGQVSRRFKVMHDDKKEAYLKRFFHSGHAINYILAAYLKSKGINSKPESHHGGFDLTIVEGGCVGCVDIKRIISSLNLERSISDHYSKIISCTNMINSCKHLVICYVPLLEYENPYRMKKLLSAYSYFLSEMKPKQLKNKPSVHIIPVDKNGTSVEATALLETYDIMKIFI